MICPRCRTDIPDNSKFCRECGVRLTSFCPQCGSEVPSDAVVCEKCSWGILSRSSAGDSEAIFHYPGEKKHVTVLFSDLSGYTSLTENLDPEDVKEIMGRIFTEITKVVERYEGFIEKYVGDAVMVLFGAVKTHEDDPIRAIRAALEIHDAVKALDSVREKTKGKPLLMHSGINTGLVVIEGVDQQRGEHGALGDTINVAARLLQCAKADQIIIGAETRRQAEGFFLFEQMPPLMVKGKQAPLSAYRVLSAREEPHKVHRLSGVRSRMVGRDTEMSLLQEALSNLKQGQGSVISIIGDAGTGKSRLVEEFKAALDLNEIRWREGHAYPYAQNTPYSLLIDLFRKSIDVKENDSNDLLKQKLESRMRALISDREDLIPYVGSIFSISYPEIEQVSPEYWKARLREGIQLLLSRLSQTGPTIVCLEDLHWADPSTVEIIRSLLSSLSVSVLFICVYRPSFALLPDKDMAGVGSIREVRLHDLSPTDTRGMLESLLQTDFVPEDLELYVREKAEGNPFYLEEIINMLLETEVLSKKDGGWVLFSKPGDDTIPSTIQGVIQARVDRLEKIGKRILQEASVIGREFTCAILKRMTSYEGDISIFITDFERLDFIRRTVQEQQGHYIFKHALIQEVVYGGLLKKERQAIHEKTSRIMEELYKDNLHVYYESLAYHFKNGNSIYKAVDYLRRSAEKNVDRYALHEANQYYREAFELLLNKTDRTRKDDMLLMETLLEWVVVYYHLAAYHHMYELLSRYEQFAVSLGDQLILGMFYVRIGSALSRMERCREAYSYLHKALAIGESTGNEKIKGYACTWLIIDCADLGLLDEALEVGKRVQGMDIFINDKYVFRLSTASLGYTHYFRGDAVKVHDAGNMLLEYGMKHDDMGSIVLGHTCHGIGYVVIGNFDSAIECFKKSIDAALEPIYSYTTKIMLGITYIANNRYREAEDVLNEIMAFNEQHSYGFVGTIAHGLMGVVMITRGELQKGVDIVKDIITSCAKTESWWRYASLNLLLGKFYLQIAQGGKSRGLSFLIKNLAFIIRTVPFSGRLAEEHLTITMKKAKEIGANNLLAQALLELGKLHRLKKRDNLAITHITEAIGLFRESGASVYQEQAEKLLAAVK